MNSKDVLARLAERFPNEPEYLQAVEEVLPTIEDIYNQHPEFEKYNLIERLCIADRVFTFRVTWMGDDGKVNTNMGYRVQHNVQLDHTREDCVSITVNLSVLKFWLLSRLSRMV